MSLFIAGLGRLNSSHTYQLLRLNMLQKFVHGSTYAVSRLIECYVMDANLNDLCCEYNICLSMPYGAVKRAITEHFWSATGLFM